MKEEISKRQRGKVYLQCAKDCIEKRYSLVAAHLINHIAVNYIDNPIEKLFPEMFLFEPKTFFLSWFDTPEETAIAYLFAYQMTKNN